MAAAALQLLLCSVAVRCSLAAEFVPLGCYVDVLGGVKDINGLGGLSHIGPYSVDAAEKCVYSGIMTLQLCSSICAIGSFNYFGVQYVSACFCGNSYGSQGVASASECNSACSGNASQICGGRSRNSVYRQIYLRPIGNEFIASSRLYLNVTSSSGPFDYSLPANRGLVHCLLLCDAACQAVLFYRGVCHLLQLPALPHELVDLPGEFFTRR